jgi:hypothetical protein
MRQYQLLKTGTHLNLSMGANKRVHDFQSKVIISEMYTHRRVFNKIKTDGPYKCRYIGDNLQPVWRDHAQWMLFICDTGHAI